MKKTGLSYLISGALILNFASSVDASPIVYNRAPHAIVTQSSTDGEFRSGRAVDKYDGTYSRTANPSEFAWWRADLGRVFEVESVFIFSSMRIKPHVWTFQNTHENTSYSWSLPPSSTYGYTCWYTLPNFVFADVVTISLQQYGILQLNQSEINVHEPNPTPEPATFSLFLVGALGLALRKRKRSAK